MKWFAIGGFIASTVGQVAQGGEGQQVFDWVQYGVLGGVVLAMIAGWLTPKPATARLEADKDKAEQRRDQLVDAFQRDVIPALVEFNRVAAALLPILQQMVNDNRKGSS